MAAHHFFGDDAKKRVASAIKAVERVTAAEIVVAVRGSSASYRDVEVLCGAALAFVALAALLFLPWSFAYDTWPLEITLCFGAGAYACHALHPLKRRLIREKRRQTEVTRTARAAFVEQRVSHTHRRGGILVFVSLFERRCELVCDWAVPEDAVSAGRRALDQAIARHDLDGFLAALEGLAAPLSAALPHHEGDENELPDELDDQQERVA